MSVRGTTRAGAPGLADAAARAGPGVGGGAPSAETGSERRTGALAVSHEEPS